ncbi:hypothetical protein FJZ18_02260 [Candidatus Pacearchaeota archaeon]|nr:hypothetical protein [Candidatus Pacearchaeota archaeon]
MFTAIKRQVTAAYEFAYAAILKKIHRPSLVKEWRQRKINDRLYIQRQTRLLNEECDGIQDRLDENPFRLKQIEGFADASNDEGNSACERTKRLEAYSIAHAHILENLNGYKITSQDLLRDYFSARKKLEESLQQLGQEE